jgi:raffinose/stachyose/melibiose transport system permease protein
MERALSDKKTIALFVLPGLILYGVMFFIPIIVTFFLSLTKWDLIKIPEFIGLKNYVQMLVEDMAFRTGVKNVFVLFLAVEIVQLPLALLLALLLSYCGRGLRLFKTSYFIPVVFSATAVGLVWVRIFDYSYGPINQIFKLLGMSYRQQWLSDPKTVMLTICAPLIWCKMGYYIILFYAGLKGIPKDYYEASLIDGCTGIRAVFKITIPLLGNVISLCISLGAIGALSEYPLIYVMTLGGPFKSSITPAIEMYEKTFLENSFGYGSALAVSIVILSLVVSKILGWIFPVRDIQY